MHTPIILNEIGVAPPCGMSQRCLTRCRFAPSTWDSYDLQGFASAEHHPAAMPGADWQWTVLNQQF